MSPERTPCESTTPSASSVLASHINSKWCVYACICMRAPNVRLLVGPTYSQVLNHRRAFAGPWSESGAPTRTLCLAGHSCCAQLSLGGEGSLKHLNPVEAEAANSQTMFAHCSGNHFVHQGWWHECGQPSRAGAVSGNDMYLSGGS